MIDAGIGANSASGGYDITNSCKFEADNTEYLTRTPSSDSNRQKFTTSLWVKRTELGLGVSGANQTLFGAQPSGSYSNANTFQWGFTHDDKFGLGLQTYWVIQTNRVFRDTSAWYHIVVRTDTTQAFAHNRVRLYVNGTQDTSFSINALSSIAQNNLLGVNHTTRHQIGSLIANSWHSKCYIAEINHIDGQSLDPTYFGEFDDDSGIWKAKEYTGTYGTNGFYLDFENSANLGEDQSGNNNDWALNNLTAADQATDTPTNNFAIGNPLNVTPPGIFTEGATRWVSVNGTGMNGAWNLATMALTGGKWHCEVKCISTSSYYQWGISPTHINDSFSSRCMYRSDGNIYNAGSGGNTTGHTSYTAGDIIGMSYDASANTVIFSKNGTAVVTKTAIAHDDPYFFGGTGLSSGTYTGDFNFGGYTSYTISSPESDENGYGTFEYAPPSGYYALCTKNLAEYG